MNNIDTLRQAVRNTREAVQSGQGVDDQTANAYERAVRALVVQELAGEPDAETLEKATEVAAEVWLNDEGKSVDDSAREMVVAAAPHIRAPLAAKLAQVEVERDAFLRYGDDHADKARTAEARVASLEAALGKYGRHTGRCAIRGPVPFGDRSNWKCDCGFADALRGGSV